MTTGTHCVGCVQQPYGGGLVTFSGTSTSGIMLIGESPWYDEIAAGTPFAGAAGTVLDRLLQRVNLSRADVIVTNSAWCRARRLGWYDSKDTDAACAMAQCRPYLDALIERMRPKVLVPMGNVALRRVCGVSGIESYAGYVLDTVYGIPAVPTFHPSYIMQGNAKLSPVVIYALDRAKEIATHGFTRPTYNLMCDPTVATLTDYVADALRLMGGSIPSLFVDLETPESSKLDEEEVTETGASWQIIRASFSIEDNAAVSFPWTPPYITLLQTLLDTSDEVVEWATNHFDTRRLRAAGLRLPKRIVSGLWCWHFLQSDLRKGLEYVAPLCGAVTPWKHRNISDPPLYSAMDSLEGRRAYTVTKAALVSTGRWDIFERHCIAVDPILQRMGDTGILIDVPERHHFMDVLLAEHTASYVELQEVVPESSKPRKYFKRLPLTKEGGSGKVVELCDGNKPVMVESGRGSTPGSIGVAVGRGSSENMDHVSIVDHGSALKFTTSPTKKQNTAISHVEAKVKIGSCGELLKTKESKSYENVLFSATTVIPKKLPSTMAGDFPNTEQSGLIRDTNVDAQIVNRQQACLEKGTTGLMTESASSVIIAAGYKYAKILDLNPASWPQVQNLAKALNVKLPKRRDAEGDDNVSTERKYLLSAARKHRAFTLILQCRERRKLLSTYQWQLNEHGRATTVYGWAPSTLRKSSRANNLQNIPKRSKLAKKFRRMIVAAPGHMLVEADFSAIEAVLEGWFAGSTQYIQLAKAGVHGWLTQAMHGTFLSPDDTNLKQLCGEAKEAWPDDYDRAKRIVHASNFKTTPIKIAEEYPEEFPTVAAARKLQNFYFDTPAGQDIRRWQDKICMQAAHDGYLDNPFKYRHYFYEVSHYDKRRDKFVPGDDAKRCIAFLPQSTASAIQSEVLLRLAAIQRMLQWLRLIIHDSFLCEPPENDAMECAHMLQREMILPIPELGGLTIGVEVSMGKNWAPYDAATNPNGMRKVL